MKKSYQYMAWAMLAVLLVGCKHAEPEFEGPVQPGTKTFVFAAHMENDETKTSLSDNGNVTWGIDDQVKFIYSLDGKYASADTREIAIENNGKDAFFTVDLPDGFEGKYALYPADTEWSGGEELSVGIPAVQDGTFAGASLSLARWDGGEEIAFKYLCGFVQIVVDDAEARKLVFTAKQDVAGVAKVAFEAEVPVIDALTGGVKEISAPIEGAGSYYLALVPGTLDGFSVALYDGDGKAITEKSTDKSLTVARKTVVKLGVVKEEIVTGDAVFILPEGRGAKTGADWDNAGDITLMLDVMQSDAPVTKTFHLGEGDYNISDKQLPAPKGSEIAIYGGYPADAAGTDLSGRDVTAHVSRIVSDEGKRAIRTATAQWVFDGLSFTSRGYPSQNSAPGCALLLLAGTESAVVNDCSFVDCLHDGNQGGAVRVAVPATFTNCTFSGNESSMGSSGAVWVMNTGVLEASNCLFVGNATKGDGKCGGAIFNNGGVVKVTDCSFIDNTAEGSGGYGGAIASHNGTVYAERCYFRGTKGLVKVGGHHIDMRSGDLGISNSVFSGPFGQGVNQVNNALGGTPKPLYIVNSTFHSQQSAALVANAGEGKIVNSIIVNGASSGDGISVSSKDGVEGKLELAYSLYNKADAAEGMAEVTTVSCVSGVKGNTACPFAGWYAGGSTGMNADDQTSTVAVNDPRGVIRYYGWTPETVDLTGIVYPSPDQVKVALGESAFLDWLVENAYLSVDIRGEQRDPSALWPGSYQGK